MPGISLISSARGDTDLAKFVDAQLNMKYRGYRSEILFHDDRTIIGYTGYEGYPVRLYESADFFSTVEGIVYNRSEKEVDSFISDLILQKRHCGIQIDSLERFLLTSDGEYFLTIYDKFESFQGFKNLISQSGGIARAQWRHLSEMEIRARAKLNVTIKSYSSSAQQKYTCDPRM
jgi:hypothetical protein